MSTAPGDMVQVHALVAYPASLLNRDDTGLAMRMPYGGVTRTRVSSQSLKKHWRDSLLIRGLGPMAVRSRAIYERLVARPLMTEHGASDAEALAIARYLMGKTVDTKPVVDRATNTPTAQSSQLLVLTKAETAHLLTLGVSALTHLREQAITVSGEKDVEKPLDAHFSKGVKETLPLLPASLDTALFGRMVTSDVFARVDAAVSVAHAFTTHREASETDYFTAVDTLKDGDDDAGAGLIQETELTSGVFYLYLVIDMVQLRSNLVGLIEDDPGLPERLAGALVEAVATVSPGAKRGSTAPYAYAEFILTERGSAQPRSLANAFLDPVPADGANLMVASVSALLDHRSRLASMYGDTFTTCAASIHEVEGIERVSLVDLIQRTFPAPE